jgi:hypothetical protein
VAQRLQRVREARLRVRERRSDPALASPVAESSQSGL